MSPVERRIGLHLTRKEPPDILVITTVGDIEEEDVMAMLADMHDLGRGSSPVFILADVSRLSRISAAARTASTTGQPSTGTGALALVGASFQQRVVVTLISKAFALLRKRRMTPMACFQTEAEARIWLDEQRRSR
jgi:hypothetical protein